MFTVSIWLEQLATSLSSSVLISLTDRRSRVVHNVHLLLTKLNRIKYIIDCKCNIQIFPNGSLMVSEVFIEDFGRYGCTAENSGGSVREEVHLVVHAGITCFIYVHNI